MNNLYSKFLAIALLLIPFSIFAQSPVKQEKCLAHHMFQEEMANNPEFRRNQEQLELATQENMRLNNGGRPNGNQQRNASVVRVIPVVFHVIHEGGVENISRAQIIDQIDSLNKDYRRLNFDAAQTPAVFQSAGGDAEIEFRLATLDPNGNCTDGITRTFSHLTNGARNNVKALIYWPSNQYLNIWVVKSIENTSGAAGIILGFAQFPGGLATTDGVVMRHDVVGSIGTSATSGFNNDGRTATHEVGHWLNLRHIWGDATCGNDFVADTPTQEHENFGCPAWPHVTCSNGPNGDMFTNYMDYTDGDCQDIFSNGQCVRMNTALSNPVSGRNNLSTPNNLAVTGTTGVPGGLCPPVAAFVTPVKYICEGTTVNFADGSWNGIPDTWNWDFPGGTPQNSSAQNPSVQYNTAGIYDVTLTVSNASGSNSYTDPLTIIVTPTIGQYSVPFLEDFETITFPGTEWYVENEGGNTWEQTTNAAHNSTTSVYINNHSGNISTTRDVFITPTYNFSNITNGSMTFWLAFAPRVNNSDDQLKVLASTTCGQLWSIRYNETGASGLGTAGGLITSPFVPNASQWRMETVSVSNSTYNNKPNIRFKFEYYQVNGNNIYIDDINVNGTVGLNEAFESSLDFEVYPNPVISTSTIEFTITDRQPVKIDVVDVLGRVVNEISESTLDAGDYQFELPADIASGLYSVRLNVNGYMTTRKVIVN